jgi:hypothetical protein
MTQKFVPNNLDKAICTQKSGFDFGNSVLLLRGKTLNTTNEAYCNTGKDSYYGIEGDVSPLTNER